MSILPVHRPHWPVAAALHRRRHADNPAAFVPTLDDDEHVLYRTAHNRHLTAVGTDAALHYRTASGAWRKVAWTDVWAVDWSARTKCARLLTAAAADRPAHTVELVVDRALVALAAERISYVHIIRRRVEVMPTVFATVEAIRVPASAEPEWRVHVEPPARQDDVLVAQACRTVIDELRSLTGC
jgi:hypothetical protein